MVVDICEKKGRLATISCDEGIENTKISIYDEKNENPIWELDYFTFKNILGEAFENPKRPFIAIIGGAKISGKLQV